MVKEVEKITLYTSKWCSHSRTVESFLRNHEIDVDKISIESDPEAKQELIEINDGFASVPTILFPDGTKLTEPTLFELRRKLGLEQPSGLAKRVRALFKRGSDEQLPPGQEG